MGQKLFYKNKNIYNLDLVLTASVTAYFQLGEKYVTAGPVRNKEIVATIIGALDNEEIFVDATTKEHKKIAQDIKQYYKGLALKAMGGRINDFEQKVLEIIKKDTVEPQEVGIITSLPKSYFRSIDRDLVNDKLFKVSKDSKHIGNEGDGLKLQLTCLSTSFIQRLGCHIVTALDTNNNIVVFFTGKNPEQFEGTVDVSCKVKRHQVSRFHGGNETVVNYVKVI